MYHFALFLHAFVRFLSSFGTFWICEVAVYDTYALNNNITGEIIGDFSSFKFGIEHEHNC